MENINPTLRFVFDIIMGIKCGIPLNILIPQALGFADEFHLEMRLWWLGHENKVQSEPSFSTDHRKILSEILENGLKGGSVLQPLADFQDEIHEIHEHHMQSYLEKLPFRLMFPMVGLFFPSLLLLIFGPLIGQIYLEVLR